MKNPEILNGDTVSRVERQPVAVDIAFIAAFAILCFWRLLLLRDVNFDDNCWTLAIYNTHDLAGFLDTGMRQARRIPQGINGYIFYGTHAFLKDPLFVWQFLNIAVQAASAVSLYFLVRVFTGNLRFCAFAAACFFLTAPIDTTQPFFTNFFTRVGTLLSIVSLLYTAKAVHSPKKWFYLSIAFVTAVFTNYWFVEASLSLEPGRLVMLIYMFRAGGISVRDSFKRSVRIVLPFVLASVPLIAYKLLYKPYGVLAGTYETGLRFLFHWGNWRQVIQHFAFDNWIKLGIFIDGFPAWSALSGLAGGFIGWFGFARFTGNEAALSGESARDRDVFILGFALFVFPVLFYMYADKVPTYSHDTRHAILMQTGNAIMLAGLLSRLFREFGRRGSFKALLAVFFATGVFFTNVNTDQYFKTWRHKQQLWQAFTARFPVLPEKADFIFDVDTDDLLYRYYADYSFEYPLNMLYARSAERGHIRNYRVIPAADLPVSTHTVFTRISWYGTDVFDTKTMIPVAFRQGRLYVGKETLALYNTPYKFTAGNPLPVAAAGPQPAYPLRARLPGYLKP